MSVSRVSEDLGPPAIPLPSELTDAVCRDLERRLRRRPRGSTVVLDAGRLITLDSLAAARLLRTVAVARDAGVTVRLAGLRSEARRTLDEVDPAVLDDTARPSAPSPLEALGARTLDTLAELAASASLVGETGRALARPFGRRGIKWDRTLQQMRLVGAQAAPIVVFISLLVGVVLALNGAVQLRQLGATIFIANLVGIAMTREMGPLITAVIVAGRSSSAIAAEIGAMVISEEIDALRVMGLRPSRLVIVPKLLALVAMLPLLTVLSNTAGIGGAYAVGVLMLDLSSDAYLSQTLQALLISDVIVGLVKSVVFAGIIGIVGVRRGLGVRAGPESVGLATTSAVVTSIVLCIIANAAFTALFYYTG
jgi:phospholipid/cholesterol/gamma-HCH transport system permease protein